MYWEEFDVNDRVVGKFGDRMNHKGVVIGIIDKGSRQNLLIRWKDGHVEEILKRNVWILTEVDDDSDNNDEASNLAEDELMDIDVPDVVTDPNDNRDNISEESHAINEIEMFANEMENEDIHNNDNIVVTKLRGGLELIWNMTLSRNMSPCLAKKRSSNA